MDQARPTRPLPSMNGWIVSNCAWAIAAWATAGRSSACRRHRGPRADRHVLRWRRHEHRRARVEACRRSSSGSARQLPASFSIQAPKSRWRWISSSDSGAISGQGPTLLERHTAWRRCCARISEAVRSLTGPHSSSNRSARSSLLDDRAPGPRYARTRRDSEPAAGWRATRLWRRSARMLPGPFRRAIASAASTTSPATTPSSTMRRPDRRRARGRTPRYAHERRSLRDMPDPMSAAPVSCAMNLGHSFDLDMGFTLL